MPLFYKTEDRFGITPAVTLSQGGGYQRLQVDRRSGIKKSFWGQVGQESNLQPAVLEHSARYPESSKDVQIDLESTVARVGSSSGVQACLTAM
jgi:hypothetical protein